MRIHRLLPLRSTLLPLIALLFLSGCLQYRSTGAMFDDQNIELRVIDAISSSNQLDRSSHIKVEVYENTVLLMGETPTEAARELAGDLARDVDRVERVVNEIEVMDRVGVSGKLGNSWLTSKVNTALATENTLEGWDPHRIKVISARNTVYLMGNVSREEGDRVTEIVRNVRGVEKVVKVFNYGPGD